MSDDIDNLNKKMADAIKALGKSDNELREAFGQFQNNQVGQTLPAKKPSKKILNQGH